MKGGISTLLILIAILGFALPSWGSFFDRGSVVPGVRNGSVAWGDYDNDGDLDILLTGRGTSSFIWTLVAENVGGTFTPRELGLPSVQYSSVAWGDYDNDGDLDILLAGNTGPDEFVQMSRVYRNDGGGIFTDIEAGLLGVTDATVAWGDYDNDGALDILLTGLNGQWNRISRVYRNNGGSFEITGAGLPGVSNGSSVWGDYDNDGDLDILLTWRADSGPISRLYHNVDGESFADSGIILPQVANGSVAWGDYDNDGDLDS
jgi:predicted nucleotidyltransferase